jgi:hypothetical protein
MQNMPFGEKALWARADEKEEMREIRRRVAKDGQRYEIPRGVFIQIEIR